MKHKLSIEPFTKSGVIRGKTVQTVYAINQKDAEGRLLYRPPIDFTGIRIIFTDNTWLDIQVERIREISLNDIFDEKE